MTEQINARVNTNPTQVFDPNDFNKNFGDVDFTKYNPIPLPLACSKRNILYIPQVVLNDSQGRQFKQLVSKDDYAKLFSAQISTADELMATLVEKQSKSNDRDYILLVSATQVFVYSCMSLSQFNVFIDFNELNRMTLQDPKKALHEIYPLLIASSGIVDWSTVNQSKNYSKYSKNFRDLALKALNMKEPPIVTNTILKDVYAHYKETKNTILDPQRYEPWNRITFEAFDIKALQQNLEDKQKVK